MAQVATNKTIHSTAPSPIEKAVKETAPVPDAFESAIEIIGDATYKQMSGSQVSMKAPNRFRLLDEVVLA